MTERPTTVEESVAWARLRFQELFYNSLAQLLYNFPADLITASGEPFWSGAKRAPTPIVFDAKDPAHLSFVSA